MATATLEMNNPFSKIGLKRRPTYNEIINLIDENKTITGNLPDRTATFYKASPEGSFFDGTDALELLKEQQSRILQRQMQDLLLRQNVRANGGTFHLERARQSTSSSSDTSSSTELQQDRGNLSIGLQADLQRREAQLRDRQQQTGEAHRGLLSGTATPIMDRIFGGSSLSRTSSVVPDIQMPTPERGRPDVFDISSEAEEVSSSGMATAREEVKPPLLSKISYRTNIGTMSVEALKFQLFLRGVDVDDPEVSAEGLKRKGKGRGMTMKQHYLDIANKLVQDGRWQRKIEEELLRKRVRDYQQKNTSSSSK